VSRRSILNPVEQRVYGAVHIAQGLAMVVLGRRAPAWALRYIMRKARENAGIMSER
jgi:hypothetical protein